MEACTRFTFLQKQPAGQDTSTLELPKLEVHSSINKIAHTERDRRGWGGYQRRFELCFAQIPIRPLAGTIQQTCIQILSSGGTFRWHAHLEIKLASLCSDFPRRMFCKCPYVVRSLVGLQSNKRTHTNICTFLPRESQRTGFFPWRNFSFHVKEEEKRVSPEFPPLLSFARGLLRYVTGVQMGSDVRATWTSAEGSFWWAVAAGAFNGGWQLD